MAHDGESRDGFEFDVFISFSSADQEAARGISNYLKWRGISTFFSPDRASSTIQVIDTVERCGCLLFLGGGRLGNYQIAEIESARKNELDIACVALNPFSIDTAKDTARHAGLAAEAWMEEKRVDFRRILVEKMEEFVGPRSIRAVAWNDHGAKVSQAFPRAARLYVERAEVDAGQLVASLVSDLVGNLSVSTEQYLLQACFVTLREEIWAVRDECEAVEFNNELISESSDSPGGSETAGESDRRTVRKLRRAIDEFVNQVLDVADNMTLSTFSAAAGDNLTRLARYFEARFGLTDPQYRVEKDKIIAFIENLDKIERIGDDQECLSDLLEQINPLLSFVSDFLGALDRHLQETANVITTEISPIFRNPPGGEISTLLTNLIREQPQHRATPKVTPPFVTA